MKRNDDSSIETKKKYVLESDRNKKNSKKSYKPFAGCQYLTKKVIRKWQKKQKKKPVKRTKNCLPVVDI